MPVIHHATIRDVVLGKLIELIGEMVGVDEKRLEYRVAGVDRIAGQMHDRRPRQRLVDQSAVAEIEWQLVDRVAVRAAPAAGRPPGSDGRARRNPSAARRAAGPGRWTRVARASLAPTRSSPPESRPLRPPMSASRVAAEYPLHQRRSGAGHADDEDRAGCLVAALDCLHRFPRCSASSRSASRGRRSSRRS